MKKFNCFGLIKSTNINSIKKFYQIKINSHSSIHVPHHTNMTNLEVIQTKIDRQSQEFQDNYQNIQNQVSILNYHMMKILECGGKVSNDRHISRGKLMVRDRIDKIIDKG